MSVGIISFTFSFGRLAMSLMDHPETSLPSPGLRREAEQSDRCLSLVGASGLVLMRDNEADFDLALELRRDWSGAVCGVVGGRETLDLFSFVFSST